MRTRWLLLLVLVVSLLAWVPTLSPQASPGTQATPEVLFARTRVIRIPGRAPNRESGATNPGGLTGCNTSLRDEAVYFGDGYLHADRFPGNTWVLALVSGRDNFSEHVSFWVKSDRNGAVYVAESDVQATGADPRYTVFIGSNGRIAGLCLKTLFDLYGNPVNLYNSYTANYPPQEESPLGSVSTAGIQFNSTVCVVASCQADTTASGFKDVIYMGSGVVYAIKSDGSLYWYRQDGWETGDPTWAVVNGSQWVNIGSGWADFETVFSGGDGVIYGILPDGRLLWYRNDCWYDGGACWNGPIEVGTGWAFTHVFSMGQGVIYTVTNNGDLYWYRHDGWQTGDPTWAEVNGSQWVDVSGGWGDFQTIFPASDGTLYSINGDGQLMWYRNDCWYDAGACWNGPIEVGTGWAFRQVFAGDEGVVYAIKPNGDLYWYRHDGWEAGDPTWAEVNGSQYVVVGNGW